VEAAELVSRGEARVSASRSGGGRCCVVTCVGGGSIGGGV